MLEHIPTWKLILHLIKNIILLAIPLIIIAICIILFLQTCGDMPY